MREEAFLKELQLIGRMPFEKMKSFFKIYRRLQKLPAWVCDGHPGGNALALASLNQVVLAVLAERWQWHNLEMREKRGLSIMFLSSCL